MKKWISKGYKLFKEHRKRLNDTIKYVNYKCELYNKEYVYR